MKNQPENNKVKQDAEKAKTKVKTNTYTPEEKKFADGEGSKLDKAMDSDATNPATRGE